MRKVLVLFILAGALGCKTDSGSKAASQLAEDPGFTHRNLSTAPSPDTPQPTALVANPDPRPLVVCFGDSLTAGFGADDGQSYPDYLQRDLDAKSFHYRVVNEGISGNTTKDGLDRLTDIVSLHPAVVVLEFGGNDGLRGLNVQTTRQNLSAMIVALQAAGAKVVLAGITLPPDYGPDYIKSFTANYADLAHQYSIPVLPFLLDHVYGVPGMMQADNTHATNKGNAIVARNVLPYVTPLLHR